MVHRRRAAARSRKTGGLARKVARIQRQISVQADRGFVTTTVLSNGSAIPSYDTNTTQCLTLISQGDDVSNRQGNSVALDTVEIRGYVARIGVASAFADVQVRVILFRVRATNGVTTALTNLFSPGNTSTAPMDFYNFNYVKNEHGEQSNYASIIYDRRMHFPLQTGTGAISTVPQAGGVRTFQWTHRVPRKFRKCTYDASTATVGSTEQNHYFAFIFSNLTTAQAGDVVGNMLAKVTFTK